MPREKQNIAVMIDLDWAYRHHQDVYAGVQQFAQTRIDWDVITDPHADGTLPSRGKKSPYDGVVARATKQLQQRAKRLGVPVVNVWLNSPTTSVPSVFPDFPLSGILAADHLRHRGIRRFAFLGFTRDMTNRLQWEAFRDHGRQHSCTFTSLLVGRSYADSAKNWAKFRRDLDQWMDGWKLPCGVLASRDLLARYLADACVRRGWRVPEDVAIVGTGDESLMCQRTIPSLSSIDLNYEQVGVRAAELLAGMLQGKAPPKEPILVPPRGLFPRRSTDMVAVTDEMVVVALQFMSQNLARPINVDDVAAAIPANRRTLERRFRDALNRSINEELNRLRLERAKRYLMESEIPVKAVAAQCGFGSVTQMGLVFRRYESISPSDYRQQHMLKK